MCKRQFLCSVEEEADGENRVDFCDAENAEGQQSQLIVSNNLPTTKKILELKKILALTFVLALTKLLALNNILVLERHFSSNSFVCAKTFLALKHFSLRCFFSTNKNFRDKFLFSANRY